MSDPREIELKFEVDPTKLASLKRRVAAMLELGQASPRHLVSVYYDTPKHALRGRGVSLRIRQDGERRLQTLKTDGGLGAGLFDRAEWECEIAGEAPDPDLFDDPRASRLLRSRGSLAPLFETRIERTSWTIVAGTGEVELSIDGGTVSAGPVSRPVAEIELELKGGDPVDLFGIARRLAETGALQIGVTSKSECGYGLLDGSTAPSAKAGPVALTSKMTAGEAFQAIARSCLRHFRLNEAILVERRTAESLHQARVAMRRLRSAFSLFKNVVDDGEVEALKRELRSLSTLLGVARNLDVYRERVVGAEMERDAAEPGLAEFAARLGTDRERAYDQILRKLGSKRFRAFMVELSTWVEVGPWLSREVSRGRDDGAWTFAATILERRRRRVRTKGRHLDRQSPDARHQVRIDAKKLRYASEFFAELVPGRKRRERHKAFVSALEQLQSCLGDLNDIQTGHELAESLAQSAPASLLPFAAGHAAGAQDGREEALVAAAVEAHAAFAEAKPFWR
ncbi:CHAD domain-containing protein [uncultured Enterovirga sp.]|uniref:CYTH and CHAD domain-containing protein n=1 Tax=uncultured Enterovirga sp. TaxID=2026352 RepID=UPI0035CB43E9